LITYLTILKRKTTGEEREVNGTFSQEMLSFKTNYEKKAWKCRWWSSV